MPGKIFVNYRRDDDPNGAARVRDGLAGRFGVANVFMDVDNLLAGQRFDEELAKALAQCDVLVAVIGTRWLDLMKTRASGGDRDYVREEIAGALQRRLVVIPVRVGREGGLAPLPRPDQLPDDIRELVQYQKHDVAHERFGRDIGELADAIATIRKGNRQPRAGARVPWAWVGATAASVLAIGYAGAYYSGVPLPWPTAAPNVTPQADTRVAEVERLRAAAAKAEEDRKRSEAEAAKLRAEADARQKADAEAKRKADEAERQRVAAAEQRQKELDEQRRKEAAAVEAKRKADEEAARRVPQVGQTFRDCTDGCPEMVVVPAGSFTMGSNDYDNEKSPRTVTIRQPFAVGKFEVTFGEWEACVTSGGCTSNRSPADQGWGKGRRPVINVSWDDAKQYVAWLSRKTGQTYRLLTEAEWEYAARARGTGKWTFGDDERRLGEFGWYSANAGGKTQPVGGKAANAFGVHDMHGNVWEWVEDCWHANYNGAPSDGSAWTTACTDGSRRVLLGGSWGNFPVNLRSASRVGVTTDFRNGDLGLRVGRTLTP